MKNMQHGRLIEILRLFLREIRKKYLPKTMDEVWTEYMDWLSFVNAGMLWKSNVLCLDYAIENLPEEAPIVEIGSFCGLSTNLITYLKDKHGKKNPLITCDQWSFVGAEQGPMLADSKHISHEAYRQFVKETYIRNIQMFSKGDLPYTIEQLSDDFFQAWADQAVCEDVLGREIKLGGPISFCFIDGDHSYAVVKRDFENCDRYLQRGGFILFDDSADYSEWEVNRLMPEIRRSGRSQLVAKNPNYLFRKR
jgi:predicted O-methyltransferase YrrM